MIGKLTVIREVGGRDLENALQRAGIAPAVYFIRAETLQLIKIGHSRSPFRRFGALQADNPDTLTLLGLIWTPNARVLEQTIHDRFREHRRHGEWLSACDPILDFIKTDAEPQEMDRQLLIDEAMRRRPA